MPGVCGEDEFHRSPAPAPPAHQHHLIFPSLVIKAAVDTFGVNLVFCDECCKL